MSGDVSGVSAEQAHEWEVLFDKYRPRREPKADSSKPSSTSCGRRILPIRALAMRVRRLVRRARRSARLVARRRVAPGPASVAPTNCAEFPRPSALSHSPPLPGIHQVVPMLHRFDAVGNHVRSIRAALREKGIPSEVYVENVDPETAETTRLAHEYESGGHPGDLIVYHHATASGLVPWLVELGTRLVVVYHNVTPARYFEGWADQIAEIQVRAHAELRMLSALAIGGIADSEFNRRDLKDAGFMRTWVEPPAFLPPSHESATVQKEERSSDQGMSRSGAPFGEGSECNQFRKTAWLCVGRLAPNKAVERVICGLRAFRQLYDPEATLTVVGRSAVPAYGESLRSYASALGLADAVSFEEKIDDEGLHDLYRSSDVLVLGSEHEGFCVPLVESMAAGLPIAAYASGAVPEVAGNAAALYRGTDAISIAEAVRLALGDRATFRERAGKQLARLGLEGARERYVSLLIRLLNGDRQ